MSRRYSLISISIPATKQCLNTANTKTVRATVARLPPAQVLPFFQQIVSKFEVCWKGVEAVLKDMP